MNRTPKARRIRASIILLARAGMASAGVLAGIAGCEVVDPVVTSLSGPTEPALPTPEQAAVYQQDPIAASELRERALEELSRAAIADAPELRANALEAMAPTPSRLENLLPNALTDQNAGVRSIGAMMVGRTSLGRLSSLVRTLTNDPSPYVQASAIYALAANGRQANPTPIGQLLLTHPQPSVRAHAAFLLGELKEPSAIGLLRDASRQPIPRADASEVRLLQLQIAEAMVKLGDESKMEVIRAALYPSQIEDLEATALAVQIIGELRDKGSSSELIYLTAFKDRQGNRMPAEIRLGAAAAMAKLGNPRGSFIADEFLASPAPSLRAQAAYVYGETRLTETLAKLELLLQDPNPLVRVAAAAAILKVTSAPHK